MTDIDEVLEVADRINPILAGRASPTQGAIIAELAGRWLAGHPKKLRDALLQLHFMSIDALIEINAKQMFGEAGHPADRPPPEKRL